MYFNKCLRCVKIGCSYARPALLKSSSAYWHYTSQIIVIIIIIITARKIKRQFLSPPPHFTHTSAFSIHSFHPHFTGFNTCTSALCIFPVAAFIGIVIVPFSDCNSI